MTTKKNTIIVGAGLSGLTIAHKLAKSSADHNFIVLEKNNRAGGCIQSNPDNGYITEIGPHGFLDNCHESKELLRETGLEQESVKAPLIDFVRYVYLHGKLNLIPQTPKKIFTAPLIPWKDKIRVLQDLWKKPLEGEPTVAKWIDHRFGPALLPYVDAVFTGTYAGDLNELKIDAVMPGVRELEKKHGSVIRGLIAKMIQSKKSGNSQKISMPAMTSFPGGMQRLAERLAEPLIKNGQLHFNSEVSEIGKDADGWWIQTASGEKYTTNNLVLALPVNQSLHLLQGVDNSMPLTSIPQTKIATVVFGYDNGATLPPGFGFLTPEVEKKFTLGALFSSNMFPGRAPEGHIVFEVLIGGRRHPERLELSNYDLIKHALKDVKDILQLPGEPSYTTVLRSSSGIPQLEKDYPALLAWKDALTKQTQGLHVCGFGWGGIGINDMIKGGAKIAKDIEKGFVTDQEEAEIKKVYF